MHAKNLSLNNYLYLLVYYHQNTTHSEYMSTEYFFTAFVKLKILDW